MRFLLAMLAVLATFAYTQVAAVNLLDDREFASEMSDVRSLLSSAENAAGALDALDNGATIANPAVVDVASTAEVPEGQSIAALVDRRKLRKIKKVITPRVVSKAKSSKGDKEWEVENAKLAHPLVDRGAGRKRSARYTVIASLDGANGKTASFKKHSKADLDRSAAEDKARAAKQKKAAQRVSAEEKQAAKQKAESAAKLNQVADQEDEITKLDRLQNRMARLIEKMSEARPDEPLEVALQRKHSYLGLYAKMKQEAKELMESYALRTGSSVLSDAPIDPALKAFLPPTSLAAILDHYTKPSNVRDRESPNDVIPYTDAQRIQFKIDTFRALRDNKPFPQDPFAPPFVPKALEPFPTYNPQRANENTILARQEGAWGNGRPVLTTGKFKRGPIGDVHVHLVDEIQTPFVSNANTHAAAGGKALPFNVSAPFYDSEAERHRWNERLIAANRKDEVSDQKFY